jgi:two-component system chemotaxis sensor kinase CheA
VRRALIIDPSQFQRNLLSPLLAMAGFDVVMAEDAEAARQVIDRGPAFDIILTDAWISASDLNASRQTPIIGLYDDGHTPGDRSTFSETASRFDRDSLLSSIDAALRHTRTAA